MSRIGNTSTAVFLALGQFCWYTANGFEIVMSKPHPDAPRMPDNSSVATFSVIEGKDVEITPVAKDSLNLINHLISALTGDRVLSLEKSFVDGEDVEKYTITIKNKSNNENCN